MDDFSFHFSFLYLIFVKKKGEIMKTQSIDTNTYILEIPSIDKTLFESLVKKMGWVFSEKKSGIEKGLEDIEVGRVYSAKDSQDLIKQILG